MAVLENFPGEGGHPRQPDAPVAADHQGTEFHRFLRRHDLRRENHALRVAASCWGVPEEAAADSVLLTWNASRVGIERTMAAVRDLPVIIDETSMAKRKEAIEQVLYDAAGGKSKNRGTTTGRDQLAGWKTVLITSGEAPITSFGRRAGPGRGP